MSREGKKIRARNLELRYAAPLSPLPSGTHNAEARVAIVVPRHGQTAVERNRVRRLIREHLRKTVLDLLPPVDIVIRALPGAYATDGEKLRSELTEMTTRFLERGG